MGLLLTNAATFVARAVVALPRDLAHARVIYTKVILFWLLLPCLAGAQVVNSFEGIDAAQVSRAERDVDPNGAVGTKQYMEWTNVNFQAYDKVTFAPVWSTPQPGTLPFQNNLMTDCYSVGGDGIITFDRLALRWVIAVRSTVTGSNNSNNYYYCIAISSTDDLASSTLKWSTYEFSLNPVLGANSAGNPYWPDWPRLGTWWDAYYVSFDLNDVNNSYEEIGVVVCALDRTSMLAGSTPRPMQCFSDPNPIPIHGSLYLKHSLIPADLSGTNAPPTGRDEYMVSIQNPPNDGKTTTSTSLNLWDFHVDWVNPANSKFTTSALAVSSYTPGCYNPKANVVTWCVPESTTSVTHNHVDSVGDRLMARMDYRNFGSYESFLVSHAVRTGVTNFQTGIRWYELRGGPPAVYQSGTVNPDQHLFRFMPSIAQDRTGHAAVGYNVSSGSTHPGIRTSWWSLHSQLAPKEVVIYNGGGDEENSPRWGDYSSMTVDPVDGCTFWYVTQYFAQNQTGNQINWNTRIGNFKISNCKPK
jgi:hypothetical protein